MAIWIARAMSRRHAPVGDGLLAAFVGYNALRIFSLMGSVVVSRLVECRTETLEMRKGNDGRLKAKREVTIEARIWRVRSAQCRVSVSRSCSCSESPVQQPLW